MSSGFPSRSGLPAVALLALWLAACDSGPRAPALRDDPVYQNDREGFRFLAPEGWQQRIRGEAPSGKVEHERTLVDYRPATPSDNPGTMRVSLVDLPPSADLAALVSAPSYSVQKWVPTGTREDVTVGEVPAARYAFTGNAGKLTLMKEVVAVRRGGRVYFFTAVFGPKDTDARDQLRRVVGSVIWK